MLVAACASGGPPAASPTAVPPSAEAFDSPAPTAQSSSSPVVEASPAGDGRLRLVATHGVENIPGLAVAGYLTAGPDGRLYVTNGASEILVLDREGNVVDRIGEAGTEPGQFDFRRHAGEPDSDLGSIAFADDGSIYVVEGGNKRVQRFDASWTPNGSWGTEGSGPGQFLEPIGIATSPAGEVFVVDDVRDDIQVFTPDGEYLRTIGRHGSADGEMAFTGNIRFAPDGSLVNADFDNARVQAWDDQGAFKWTTGSRGVEPGRFVEPQDVAFGPTGELFVVDDSRVQVFDTERNVIATWPDAPSPEHLASIAITGDTLWVLAPYLPGIYEIDISGLTDR